jgi:hypothetical protein
MEPLVRVSRTQRRERQNRLLQVARLDLRTSKPLAIQFSLKIIQKIRPAVWAGRCASGDFSDRQKI